MQLRMRMRLWPKGAVAAASSTLTAKPAAAIQRFFSWKALGAALLGIWLARWTWVLFAPASPAVPPANWEASGDAARLFGTASVTDAGSILPMDNIKLVGVFAHRTRGFAVMQIDDKQVGVAQGEEIKPGIRLAETYPDHVMIERGSVLRRVDMSGATAPAAVAATAPSGMQAAMAAPTVPANAAPPSLAASHPGRLPSGLGPDNR